jgi:hypothetical protein
VNYAILRMWKGLVMSCCKTVSQYMLQEGKPWKFPLNSQPLSRESNPGCPEYKAGALATLTFCSVIMNLYMEEQRSYGIRVRHVANFVSDN